MSKRKETYISDELGCLRLISTTQADNILRGYTFQYDDLSRLTGAAYSENGSASTHYGTSYQYDLPRSWGQGYDYHQIEELVIEYFVK